MALCQLPQVIRIVKTKTTEGVSLLMQIVLSLGVICWLVAGILYNSAPMYISNGVCTVFSLFILVRILCERYGRKR